MANNELQVVWSDLKKSPAVLITVIVAIALILYYVYKQNSASTVGTSSTSTNTNPQSPYNIIDVSVTPPAAPTSPTTGIPTGTKSPTPIPPTPIPTGGVNPPAPIPITKIVNELTGMTRSKSSGDKNSSGVPVYSSPGGSVTRYQGYNSQVSITGTTSQSNGRDYYPISGGGYIKETDLVGFG